MSSFYAPRILLLGGELMQLVTTSDDTKFDPMEYSSSVGIFLPHISFEYLHTSRQFLQD